MFSSAQALNYGFRQGAGYILDPEFHTAPRMQDIRCRQALNRMIERTYPRPTWTQERMDSPTFTQVDFDALDLAALTKRSNALVQLNDYNVKTGAFKDEMMWTPGALRLAPAEWFSLFAFGAQELRAVAMRVLAQVAGASAAERAHKVHKFMKSKSRNRMSMGVADHLTYIYFNTHQAAKTKVSGRESNRLDSNSTAQLVMVRNNRCAARTCRCTVAAAPDPS